LPLRGGFNALKLKNYHNHHRKLFHINFLHSSDKDETSSFGDTEDEQFETLEIMFKELLIANKTRCIALINNLINELKENERNVDHNTESSIPSTSKTSTRQIEAVPTTRQIVAVPSTILAKVSKGELKKQRLDYG
jgi:hypothetical protein